MQSLIFLAHLSLSIIIYVIFINVTVNSFPDLSQAGNVQIVYPRVITDRNRRHTYNKSKTFNKLKTIEVKHWVLEINSEDDGLVTSSLQAEWIRDGDEGIKRRRKSLPYCEYAQGIVRDLETVSRVAVTICEEKIIGYIYVAGVDYFLEPLDGTGQAHLLYNRKSFIGRTKRSSLYNRNLYLEENQWIFNLTGDTIEIGEKIEVEQGDESIDNDEEYRFDEEFMGNLSLIHRHEWWREDPDELGYFYDSAWSASDISIQRPGESVLLPPLRWLEIALAVDYTLIAFHGKEKVEQYVLALMNIVSAIYQDISLEANVKLVITRLLLYENKKQSVIRPGNAKKSLENVNSWNNKLHISLAPGEPRHDVAIWITRSDIGGPSGYAPVSGTCDPKRSCALNRDEGLTSAFIIAHEMAHILGLSHDGDKKSGNKCGDDAVKGSVMAPMVAATFNKFFWSDCSREEFRKTAKKWWCLSNPPTGLGEIVLNATLQNSFSMDEQCRMEFGEGYTLCRAFDIIEPCSHLWCGHIKSPLVCKTKKGPPLEGTECGLDKWCVNGYCEEIGRKQLEKMPVVLNPQNGGWSDWSLWGPCSRSCGTGVEFRTRKCNNPTPLYGGSDCHGLAEEWRTCNLHKCPEPLQDMRAQQCARMAKLLNLLNKREGNLTWLPHENDNFEKQCKLICISKETKEVFETAENLIDGTPCSYENPDNICIQGICQLMGCDGQLFSKMKTDACGVCGGNNSDCSNVKSVFQRKLKREVSRVAVLPRMARNVEIEANMTMFNNSDPAVAFILKNRRKKKYTITIPNSGIHTEILEGTKFYYRKTGNNHNIWAKGPVLAEMVVLLYAPISEIDNGLNVSLRSEYIANKNILLTAQKFNWILGGWGPCSASCGGGRRQQTVACWDSQTNKLVRRKFCSLIAKPILQSEKCNNFDCNFQWVVGKWEPCSATCGLNGIQHRELYCVPRQFFKNNSDTIWKYMVNPAKCEGIGPITERPCNRETCLSFWTFGEWSQCSASCGSGVSTRFSYCPPLNNEKSYSCGGSAPPFQTRVCQGNFTRHNNPLCTKQRKKTCKEDQSVYCPLDILSKYCKLGGFRRLCCKSCATFRLSPVSV